MHRSVRRDRYLEKLMRFKDRTDIVKVVSGIRRCGKSTLLLQYMNILIENGIRKDDIVYINFESADSERFLDRKELASYLYGIVKGRRTYIMLDEIQRVSGWEIAVNAMMVDLDADIYITGSNAYFLSTELSTYLTGRCVEIEMLPLSFGEFMLMNPLRDGASIGDRLMLYLNMGGMPVLDEGMEYADAQDVLNNINSTIVLKDVVARNNIRDAGGLLRVLEYVYSEIGNPISPAKMSKHLGVSDKTVDNYLLMLEEALLIMKVERYDMVGKRILSGPRKYYCTDVGMRNAYLRARNRDVGRVIENTVYLELRRRGYRITVGKYGDNEVDFAADRNGVMEYYQIAERMSSDEVADRETRPLRRIDDNYAKTIITMDPAIQSDMMGIAHVSLADFLLRE
jgi:predicted AAA+ superfamily ATPase